MEPVTILAMEPSLRSPVYGEQFPQKLGEFPSKADKTNFILMLSGTLLDKLYKKRFIVWRWESLDKDSKTEMEKRLLPREENAVSLRGREPARETTWSLTEAS
ncbi:hypothetical protein KSP40_PGU022410 [Platanthera guangdongensis]|uniref:Uncharacterized protein n=1 Tax=Platanthera guangdongensis TaxID=2320717 RepID=A0ABR2N5U3_9ASPA